jgi:FMN-dependent NADH-azoreductase
LCAQPAVGIMGHMNLLHIDSSIQGVSSVSRALSACIVDALRLAHPFLRVTYRDLASNPLPPVSGPVWNVLRGGGRDPAALDTGLVAFEEAVQEFLACDAVVIGAPMYNFTIPSSLKCWIDAICQPRRTFEYTPNGPRGLAGGKRVFLAVSRGNRYSGTPLQAADFQEPYLKTVFALLGIKEVDIIRAEGVNIGAEARDQAIETARAQIASLFPAVVAK